MTVRRDVRICLTALASFAALAAALLVRDRLGAARTPAYRPVTAGATAAPIDLPSIDEKTVRDKAWQRAQALLAQAEQAGQAALDKHLAGIPAFLDERKKGSQTFAAKLLSLKGKYQLIKSKIRSNWADDYASWLATAFADHVFRSEELQQTIEATARAFLSELDGIDNHVLVQLRADTDSDLAAQSLIPALRSDTLLKARYDALTADVLPVLSRDLRVTAGREAVSWIAGDIAAAITLRVGAAVAARMGLSAGILSAGAAASWATLGVSVVACIAVDQVISLAIKHSGYAPEEKIAARVDDILDDIGRIIIDGQPRPDFAALAGMRFDLANGIGTVPSDTFIGAIDTTSRGLRAELTLVHQARVSLRREILSRLIRNQEITR